MILDSTLKSLRFVLGEAKTTTDCDVVSCFADTTDSEFITSSVNIVTNGTTAVAAVAAPGAGVQRQVNEVRLFNRDTASHLVTLQLDNNGTIAIVEQVTVPSGGSFLYTPDTSASYSLGGGGTWNAGTIDAVSANLAIRAGNTLDLANSITVSATVVAASETISATGKIGTLAVGASTAFSAFSTHFAVSSGTLDIANTWNVGSVVAVLPTQLQISGTTLEFVANPKATFWAEGVGNNLTLTGSTQAGALALTQGLNLFGTVAATSGALLPQIGVTVATGTWVDCFNTTVTLAQIYGTSTQTIDGAASATGVPLSGGNRCRFFANTGSTWVSAQLGAVSS